LRIEIRIGGLGGQGVVLAGQIFGKAAVYSGKNAVQTQSYGAEARGSNAKSEIIISDDKISFPMVRKCDVLVAMNQEAVDRNVKDLKEDGVLVVDISMVKNMPKIKAKVYSISATEVAQKEFAQKLYANIIMLGALAEIVRAIDDEAMEKAITDSVPKNAVAANLEAYKTGKALVK
jgi:2-oxoglutarate ferredoxin oxidoreductase subunit gamma